MNNRILIINYHYCVSFNENPWLSPTAVSPERFDSQMKALCSTDFPVIVTFDDGTRDVFLNAVPVLKKYKVPAILFCCTQPLIEKRLLNVTKIHMLQTKMGLNRFKKVFEDELSLHGNEFELDSPEKIGLGHIYRYDNDETRNFKLLLNVSLPYSIITDLLDTIFNREFGDQDQVVKSIYMNLDEIKECIDSGLEIGLHTHSHKMLSRLNKNEQEYEIRTPLEYFNQEIGLVGPALSYPFGIKGTWNEDTKDVMKHLKINKAYTLGREVYDSRIHKDSLELPRFDINDVFHDDDRIKIDL